MYYEFYLDVFFVENLILDCAALLLTRILLKHGDSMWRTLAAGVVGAAGASILILSPARQIPMMYLLTGFVLAVAMVSIAFKVQTKGMLQKSLISFLACFILLGGMYQILQVWFSFSVISLGVGSSLLLALGMIHYQRRACRDGKIYEVSLEFHGKEISLKGLLDTGNQLTEPVTGKPVNVVSYETVKTLLEEHKKFLLIPYHTIGKENGWMRGVILDSMNIKYEGDSHRVAHPIIAVSKIPVSQKNKYQIILHPMMLDN